MRNYVMKNKKNKKNPNPKFLNPNKFQIVK